MATTTYEPIQTQTLSSATNTVTFSSIPQTYTDLVLVFNGGGSATSGENIVLQFNGDTGTNYSCTVLAGNGSAAASYRESNYTAVRASYASAFYNTLTNTTVVQIMNYTNATTYKTVLSRSGIANGTFAATEAIVSLWRATPAAITSIVAKATVGNFLSGSTFTLYGISNAGDASPKANGGDVYSDNSYWYHAFTLSGNFVPNQALTADVLVIAGGGGGGLSGIPPYSGAGGGGAGGVLAFSSQSLTTSTNYSCLIGGGGNAGSSGSNSQFGSLTAAVGGGNGGTGYNSTTSGGSGGSGGGGGGNVGSPGGGGSATSGQGNAGASGFNSASEPTGGGGGGAGNAGSTGNVSIGGAGGAGTNSVTNWGALSAVLTTTGLGSSGYLAGGGGGAGWNQPVSTSGAGGIGGGGNGSPSNNASGFAGLVNTGSGGGGNSIANPTGNGGSGLIIVRYAK